MQKLLRLPAVLERVPTSRSSLYEAMERGEFPRPIKVLGSRANAWLEEEVDAYIAARVAEREAA